MTGRARTSLLALSLTTAATGATVPAQAGPAPQVNAFWLVDAGSDTRIAQLTDYQSIDLPFTPTQLNLEAEANDGTASVRFTMGTTVTTENQIPYALGGDSGGDFFPTPALRVPGWVTITARPYSADAGAGTAGTARVLHLYLRQPDHVVTSTYDAGDTNLADGVCRARVPAPPIGTTPKRPTTGAKPLAPPRTTIRCTLRAAIEQANATPGRQTIGLKRYPTPYRLSKGELRVTSDLAVYGHGRPVIDAERRSRVLSVAGTASDRILVDLADLDLVNGQVDTFDRGGVIRVENALAHINDSVIHGGQANFGGGVYLQNRGSLSLTDSIVRDNQAGHPASFGGGGATQRGGGIFNLGGVVTIRNSAVVDNSAVRGGGLANFGGTLRVENSSIIGNEARSLGGGIENRDNSGNTGILHLSYSTITGNQAGTSTADPADQRVGGGLYNRGTAFISSSVIAANTEPYSSGNPHTSPDCYSPTAHRFSSYRANLLGVMGSTCQLRDYGWGSTAWIQYGSLTSPLDPKLGVRSNVPRSYRVPLAGSPLLDAGEGSSLYPCPSKDVRAAPRPVGVRCDIGSAERQ